MALTEERKAALLAYCRIEEPTDEELITLETLYHAAVGYLEHAGVLEPPDGTAGGPSMTCVSTSWCCGTLICGTPRSRELLWRTTRLSGGSSPS